MLVAVLVIITGVEVEVKTGSVEVAIIGVVVAVISETEEVAEGDGMVSEIEGVDVAIDAVTAGAIAEAGIITAVVPVFVVAPQAPPEVFMTPPSIYIQVGAALARSYIVTPLAAPPPTASFWVSTL